MQPIVPVKIVTVEDLSARIKLSLNHNNIEGVTLLGGEPMLQAKGLAQFAYECKKMGLTVITFTGYTLESLEGNSIAGATDLISQTDILIDGPFDKEQASNRRNWAGSENQKFHYLTNRYQQGIEFAQAYSPSIEFRITKDGIIETNGWPFEIKNV
jgi:anaerobic ribonucleoside-triphosphate reductase activating protein